MLPLERKRSLAALEVHKARQTQQFYQRPEPEKEIHRQKLSITVARLLKKCNNHTIILSASIMVFNRCAIVRTVQSLNLSRIVS